MPSSLTYPGVYIEEIPSGVRTITGVATSIAAFVGRARMGPVNDPLLITSFADFERRFGGLWTESMMSYAVRDFFRNGGAQALIVRAYNPQAPTPPTPTPTPPGPTPTPPAPTPPAPTPLPLPPTPGPTPPGPTPPAPGPTPGPTPPAPGPTPTPTPPPRGVAQLVADPARLLLEAASPGSWGDLIRARIVTDPDEVAEGDPSLFNLQVALVRLDANGKVVEELEGEEHRNVSLLKGHRRQVDRVLAAESKLVRAVDFNAVDDPTVKPTAHAAPAQGASRWEAAASAGVATDARGSDGGSLTAAVLTGPGTESNSEGLYALNKADLFNLLSIPPPVRGGDLEASVIEDAIAYATKRRAIFLIDPPSSWVDRDAAAAGTRTPQAIGSASKNAALFFPRLRMPDPLRDNQIDDFVPSGAVAGVIARTDVERGVWKAPAGIAATLVGVPDLSVRLTDDDIGVLNPLGINALRALPDVGRVIWGARTREGSDRLASEWKYLPIRRLALFIEESLYRGTAWVVFEPNDEPLWAAIRLNLGAFMHSLFRQGAFQGGSARDAYEVKCDAETTTQDDRNRGVVNIIVRFAPLKPAEFVVIKIQQLAGQVQA